MRTISARCGATWAFADQFTWCCDLARRRAGRMWRDRRPCCSLLTSACLFSRAGDPRAALGREGVSIQHAV
eukprot:319707-Rhodomonas_salina.2